MITLRPSLTCALPSIFLLYYYRPRDIAALCFSYGKALTTMPYEITRLLQIKVHVLTLSLFMTDVGYFPCIIR